MRRSLSCQALAFEPVYRERTPARPLAAGGGSPLAQSPRGNLSSSLSQCASCLQRTESLTFSMVQLCLLTAGVMLCSIPACSLSWGHGPEIREIVMLLRQLQSVPSYSCLNDRAHFNFPWKRGNITQIQETQGTCFHQLMLQQTFSLLSTDASHAAWNSSVLHKLLSGLDHRLEQVKQEEEDLACSSLGIAVRKFFHRITAYLKGKKYSPCAWEIVREEIVRVNVPLRI